MLPLSSFQKAFQQTLNVRVDAAMKRSHAVTRDVFIRGIIDHAMQIVKQEGKRSRPYLANLMYEAIGGKKKREMLRISVALELFHAFALVHDDVMDRGLVRHGLNTVHVEVARRLLAAHRAGDVARVSDSQAILAGDLLFSWAHDVVRSAPEIARRVFSAMSEEVIIGQMLDVDIVTRKTTTMTQVVEKMRRKTAGYSFVKPLQFGAACAGAGKKEFAWCEEVGIPLGLAFQILDDLIDLTVPVKHSHKTPLSDLSERQRTVFTQYIFDKGTAAQKKELHALMGKRLSEKDRPRVMKLFTDSGSIQYGKAQIMRHCRQAEAAVATNHWIAPTHKKDFQTLIQMVKNT